MYRFMHGSRRALAGAALATLFAVGCGDEADGGGEGATPDQVSCAGDVCTVAAPLTNPITTSFTMTADKRWLLQGGVFVGDDVGETVLTIEAGTQIFGETSSKAGSRSSPRTARSTRAASSTTSKDRSPTTPSSCSCRPSASSCRATSAPTASCSPRPRSRPTTTARRS